MAEVGTPCDFKLLVLESVLFQRASNKESLQCEAQLEHSSPKPDLKILCPQELLGINLTSMTLQKHLNTD